MFRVTTKTAAGIGAASAALLAAPPAMAAVEAETGYVFNTFSFLFSGALVMWMAAGFAMLESGLVRTKNTATICLKNIALYSIAGILYYLIGYNLMYVDVGGFMGSISLLYNPSDAELTLLGAEEATDAMVAAVVDNGYSVGSDWFFQMVFVATAASIISGTVAERIKLWPFLIFVVVLTAIIYPIQGSWTWGGGWLSEMGFSDFAGSTIVHSVGGWAALTGAIILGARKGKYGPNGQVNPIPGANLPLATLGTFILWLGWFGFNGGSQLALGSAADATWMGIVFTNTKRRVDHLANMLWAEGFGASAVHGDKPQAEREKALAQFARGEWPLMVATDVAARGLDIPNVEVVINFSFPLTIEDYVHRVGRTGRAGKSGAAHTFFHGDGHEKALAGALQNVLRAAGADVPAELVRFGSTVKKKEDKNYGAFGPRADLAGKKATKIVFD